MMQPGSAGKATLKLEALRRIGGSALDPARVFSLVTIVECFLPLRPEEESMLWQQLRQEGAADTLAVEAMFDRAVMVSTVEEMLRPEFPAGDGEGTIPDR